MGGVQLRIDNPLIPSDEAGCTASPLSHQGLQASETSTPEDLNILPTLSENLQEKSHFTVRLETA